MITTTLVPHPLEGTPKWGTITSDKVNDAITILEQIPSEIERLEESFNGEEVNYCYREGGWAIRQIIHHLADSHLNAYIRMKLAVTEPGKTVTTYDENAWAALIDGRDEDIYPSLLILMGLHERWTMFLISLTEEQLQLTYVHPVKGSKTIAEATLDYTWHALHHLAQIKLALLNKIAQ
jgi:hypothetical protein